MIGLRHPSLLTVFPPDYVECMAPIHLYTYKTTNLYAYINRKTKHCAIISLLLLSWARAAKSESNSDSIYIFCPETLDLVVPDSTFDCFNRVISTEPTLNCVSMYVIHGVPSGWLCHISGFHGRCLRANVGFLMRLRVIVTTWRLRATAWTSLSPLL